MSEYELQFFKKAVEGGAGWMNLAPSQGGQDPASGCPTPPPGQGAGLPHRPREGKGEQAKKALPSRETPGSSVNQIPLFSFPLLLFF